MKLSYYSMYCSTVITAVITTPPPRPAAAAAAGSEFVGHVYVINPTRRME